MGCCNKIKSDAPRVRMGTDTIFSVVLYRYNGEIGTIIGQHVEEEIDPSTLENIEAEVLSSGRAEAVDVRINGRLLNIEVSKELTQRLGLGLYSLRLKVREVDSRFSDGYRDVTLMTDLCQVVPEGAYTGKPKENVAVVIAQLATGKSAYQLYLDTTTDNPKKPLPEWLASHKGDKGDSAYQIYLATTTDNPKKTEEEWLASLTGNTGKSAYESYLLTTKDDPKLSEEEWAMGGWLVILEMLRKI